MTITPEMLEAFGVALAWLCGCVGALVALAWRTGRTIQRWVDMVEVRIDNVEKRVSELESKG